MPGGYISDGPDQGKAFLTRTKALKIFVWSNTTALMSSTFAVFSHIFMTLTKDKLIVQILFQYERQKIIAAMYFMVIAFISGTCAVLPPSRSLSALVASYGGLYLLLSTLLGLMKWIALWIIPSCRLLKSDSANIGLHSFLLLLCFSVLPER